MRGKITDLEAAFTGRFSDDHAFLLTKMVARIDQVSADLADLADPDTTFPHATVTGVQPAWLQRAALPGAR